MAARHAWHGWSTGAGVPVGRCQHCRRLPARLWPLLLADAL